MTSKLRQERHHQATILGYYWTDFFYKDAAPTALWLAATPGHILRWRIDGAATIAPLP